MTAAGFRAVAHAQRENLDALTLQSNLVARVNSCAVRTKLERASEFLMADSNPRDIDICNDGNEWTSK
ncbi:hypothetical protein D7S86_16250 [Pararobbsia silviterrae]|uniref:Uncharacterized protein n=1 Tax=Pararobbsia silviterrae TaxID=1792498 RepID=A0A494XUB8_9BURK|nr:hypothetical protein D7S86_16250 [Pararobbsia silviterrae]